MKKKALCPIKQYIQARKKARFPRVAIIKSVREEHHRKLGGLLGRKSDTREKMEIERPEMLMPPVSALDFIL